jgi:spoIIIJ-associated protein
MDYVEAEGNSIDEAIQKALESLSVEREKVEVDILVSPAKGMLGIGGRKAKVRVTVRDPMRIDPDHPSPAIARDESEQTFDEDSPRPIAPETAARAELLLEEIVQQMGFTVSVNAREEDSSIWLSIDGDSTGLLIGRHGQTLDALEFLLNRMIARENLSGRIVVDCERYRERRRENLESMAKRLAQQAKTKHKPVSIEALSPRERRIVHLALRGERGITTRSSGEGFYRDLVIVPEGARSNRSASDRGTRRRETDSSGGQTR